VDSVDHILRRSIAGSYSLGESSGAVEGPNNKVKLVTRKSYDFRTSGVAKMALLHNLGRLPEPDRTHRFC